MGQAQINVRTRACSRTSIARTKQAALTHNVRGKELKRCLQENMQQNSGPAMHNFFCTEFSPIQENLWEKTRHVLLPRTFAIQSNTR